MKKEVLLIVIMLLCIIIPGLVSAENLNLKVIGTIGSYSSDVRIKTNSASTSGIDSYDMIAPFSPDSYSQFYSSVSGNSLSVDSFSSTNLPRTINLVYYSSVSQAGSLVLSWPIMAGSYSATLTDYGSDSGYGTSAGSADMRALSSYTATMSGQNHYFKIAVSSYTPPASSSSPGGSSGGVVVEVKKIKSLVLDSNQINLDLVLNSNKQQSIKLTNTGNSSETVEISLQNLDDLVIIKDKSIVLAPGESREIQLKFVAPETPGIYSGKIIIGGKEVLVSINVQSKELLFDASIVVPSSEKIINLGGSLQSQITLIPMGEGRVDVTLNYIIKDFEGRTYLSESETILVEAQKSFSKQFSTADLPEGNYILGLEVVYPNGVATSSSHFQIAKKSELDMRIILLVVLLAGVIGAVLLIIYTKTRYKKQKKLLKRR